MKLSARTGTLRLREPFRISRSVMHERDAVWIDLEHGGRTGHGEAVTSVYYDLDVPRILDRLDALRPHVESCTGPDELLAGPDELLAGIDDWPDVEPGVRCAVDAAAHDLAAQHSGRTVQDLIGAPPVGEPATARTIGITGTEHAARTAAELTARGFRVLKEKMDPRRANGGTFLGLNGIAIKSHGGTDALGFASAIELGYDMAESGLLARLTADLISFHGKLEAAVGK